LNTAAEPVLTAAQLAAITGIDGRPQQRTSVLPLDGARVVVKRQRHGRLALGYQFLSLLAWLTGQPWLRGVPIAGGARGQAVEVERLRALAQAGVAVPRVLHVSADCFVMSHAHGPDLASMLPREAIVMRERWNLGLDFLRDVHGRGQYLSQAFARNMILSPDGIVAVDFEDDPLQVMALPAAQARDWLAYLHSTLWMLPQDQPWLLGDLVAILSEEEVAVRRALQQTARRWAWLRALPRNRGRWGRDLVSLQALAQLLRRLDGQISPMA
jgi:hypothetical protein